MPPLRMVLEVDRRSEPIEGRLLAPEDAARPFVGWLGLIQVLDAALCTTLTGLDTELGPEPEPTSWAGPHPVDAPPSEQDTRSHP